MPQGTALPVVSTQVLFTDRETQAVTEYIIHDQVTPSEYLGPGLPMVIPFSPDFSFTLTRNGRLRFSLWMGRENFYGGYDDTVYVRPENDV